MANDGSSKVLNEIAGRSRVRTVVTSLQFKATVLVVALTLCVTAVVTGYFIQSSILLSREEHKQQLHHATKMLCKTISYAKVNNDESQVHDLLAEVIKDGTLAFIKVFDEDHRAVASNANPAFAKLVADLSFTTNDPEEVRGEPELVFTEDGNASHLVVSFPLTVNLEDRTHDDFKPRPTKLIGYVTAGMAVRHWHQAMATKVDLVIGVGTIAGSMAILLGFLLIRRIVSPLDSLAAKMLRFSSGELDVRVQNHRSDEIGKLSRAFDCMADEHQKTLQRLVRLNAELEDRVAERTKQLEELASKDPLTGIFNRRYFNDMLDHHFSQAVRYQQDLTCLMVDLDDFKTVNDEFGHHTGDRLLKLVADTITQELRGADICARFGGDEFVVLLPQTDLEHGIQLGHRILASIDREIADQIPEIKTAVSVGITSLCAIHAKDAEHIVKEADHAMYKAKASGKGRLVTSAY